MGEREGDEIGKGPRAGCQKRNSMLATFLKKTINYEEGQENGTGNANGHQMMHWHQSLAWLKTSTLAHGFDSSFF